MKMRYIVVAVCLLFATACGVGSYEVIGELDPTEQAFTGVVVQDNPSRDCPLLPETFRDSDLVGTWEMFAGGIGKTTLILKDNGTYKQIHDYPPINYYYESDWREWQFERHDDGTSYVHFKGMLFCGRTCSHSLGGKWYDFCDRKMIVMQEDEVVMMLVGVLPAESKLPPDSPLAAPHGIRMFEPQLDPDSNPVVYQLKR